MFPVSVDVLAGGVEEDGALELGGGVLGAIDEPEFGGVAGAIDDELEEPDGEGATTGGVLAVVLLGVSRWQPATPSTSPVHSSVISVLLIVISRSKLRKGPPADLAGSMPFQQRFTRFPPANLLHENSTRR